MKILRYFGIGAAALAWACSAHVAPRLNAKEPKPDWVDGESLEFRRDKHLLGVGIADERSAAEERARAEISKIFSTIVSVDTRFSETESTKQTGAQKTGEFEQSLSSELHTASRKILEGVEVVDHWQDSVTKQHYALAVLDRAKASAIVSDKIAGIDRQARQWKGEFEQAAEKWPRVKAAMKLLAVLKARGELSSELRVLDESGKAPQPPFDEAALRSSSAEALSSLDVLVTLSGDSAKAVETGIVTGLGALGLSAQTGLGLKATADILVEGETQTQALKGDSGSWQWARSSVTVSLKDGKTGKIFVRFEASDRQASAVYEEAARRAQGVVAKRTSEQVRAAVAEYFENQ